MAMIVVMSVMFVIVSVLAVIWWKHRRHGQVSPNCHNPYWPDGRQHFQKG